MSAPKPSDPPPDFEAVWRASRATPERVAELAGQLKVTPTALDAIGIGWIEGPALDELHAAFGGDGPRPTGAYCFPEYAEDASVVGLSLRAPDDRKGSPRGGKRGVVVPETLEHAPAPCLVVEGASDVAACLTLGLAAVGRPSNNSGADIVHGLVPTREILVVGENDRKPDGSWPGRNGANAVASRLAELRGEPVSWTLPPDGAKDIRAWLNARVAAGLNSADPIACRTAGMELLAELKAAAVVINPHAETDESEKPEKDKRSQADKLVDLACEMCRLGRDEADSAFAVRIGGPNVAVPFAGGRDALRRQLAKAFRAATNKTPSASALADALLALGGMADDAPREAVHLRVARHDDNIVIDLGDETGRAIVVSPDGWEVVERSPVLFRRTALTAALPIPVRGGDLNELRRTLNVSKSDWPLLAAWLVTALMPEAVHPILLMVGQQDSGKSTTAKQLVLMTDPTSALLRSPPADVEGWALQAAGSWVVAIDNISTIPGWLSDALCRSVSGDGWVRRRLYTDGELAVTSFRRVVLLTAIDPGALRGDLADRLLAVEVEPIADEQRLAEADLLGRFGRMQPQLLGALLDLAASVLRLLPDVNLDRLPRMADFARVLKAVDEILGTEGYEHYHGQRNRLAGEVVEADPVATAILAFVPATGWAGTSTELLAAIRPEKPGSDWPKNGRSMSARLRRLIPALGRVGVKVAFAKANDSGRARIVHLERVDPQPSGCVRPSDNGRGALKNAVFASDANHGTSDANRPIGFLRPVDRPVENRPGAIANAVSDGSDGSDANSPALSVPTEALEFTQPESGAAETGGTTGDDTPEGWSREQWAAACAVDAEGLPGDDGRNRRTSALSDDERAHLQRMAMATTSAKDIPGSEAI